MSSRKNVGLTVGTNLGLSIVNVATGVLLARLLGPDNRGELAAVQLYGVTIAGIAAVGVPDAVVYFVARRNDDSGRIVTSAAVLNLLTSIAFTVGLWFVVPVALGRQSEETKELARFFLLVIPIYVLAGMPANLLRGRSSFVRWNVIRVSGPVLWLATILLAYFTHHLTIAFLTIGFLLGQVVVLVVSSVIAAPKVARPLRLDFALWMPLLRFGLPGVLSSIPATANLRLDQMLLAAFVSNESLGLYITGVAWAGVMSPVLSAFGAVLFPRIASEGAADRRLDLLARGVRITVLVAMVLAVVVVVATPLGIRLLFGSAFADAAPAAAVLVVAAAVLASKDVLEEGWRGLGRPTEVLRAEIGGLIATVVLLVALLPPLGIMGAALASVGGYAATAVILVVRLHSLEGVAVRNLVPGRADASDVLDVVRERVRRTSER